MYAYLLAAVVILFTFYKYDLKEGNSSITIGKGAGAVTLPLNPTQKCKTNSIGKCDYSKYVLKSSIKSCGAQIGSGTAGATQSGDRDFKKISDCYDSHKSVAEAAGKKLNYGEFVTCIWPEFSNNYRSVNKIKEEEKIKTSILDAAKKNKPKSSSSSDLGETFEDVKYYVKENMLYFVIGISIIVAAIVVSQMGKGSSYSPASPASA